MKTFKDFLNEGSTIRDGYLTDNESSVTGSISSGLYLMLNKPRNMPEFTEASKSLKTALRLPKASDSLVQGLEALVKTQAISAGKELDKLEQKFKSDLLAFMKKSDKELSDKVNQFSKAYS